MEIICVVITCIAIVVNIVLSSNVLKGQREALDRIGKIQGINSNKDVVFAKFAKDDIKSAIQKTLWAIASAGITIFMVIFSVFVFISKS